MGASRSCRPWEIAAGHHGRSPLPVRLEHMAVLEKLPLRHRDPFDRLPVAQAVAGQFALLTPDEVNCVLGWRSPAIRAGRSWLTR